MIIFFLIIYCIIVCIATAYPFILDIRKGYINKDNFVWFMLLYIIMCLFWPLFIIAVLSDEYDKMKKQPLIKRDEKENK